MVRACGGAGPLSGPQTLHGAVGVGCTVGWVSSQYFRAGVVIVVRHPNGREVMAFERVDIRGSWQLPQGGMHRGEEPEAAAWRELKEETGLGEGDVVVAYQ